MKKRTYWQWVRLGLGLHIGVLLLFVGGLSGFVAFQLFLRQSRLEPIQGTILKSVAAPREDGMFTPDIRFSYTVDRRKYNGGKYRDDLKHRRMSESEVEAIVQRYSSGSTVEAWYDPKSPSFAVIDRSLGPLHYGLLIAMAGTLIVVCLFAFILIRHRARMRKATNEETV